MFKDNLLVRKFLGQLSIRKTIPMEKFFTGENVLGSRLKGDNFLRAFFSGANFQEVICWRETHQGAIMPGANLLGGNLLGAIHQHMIILSPVAPLI